MVLVEGLDASLSRPRGGRSAVLCAGDEGVYASSSNWGEQLAFWVAFGGAFEFMLFGREDLGPSVGQQVLISSEVLLLFL